MDPFLLLLALGVLLGSSQGRGGAKVGAEGGAAPSGKTLPPLPAQGNPGESATDAFRRGGSPGVSHAGVPVLYKASGLDAYIQQLYDHEAAHKSTMREIYSVPRNKAIAIAAATYYGVPASWVYGMLQGESNFYPIGVFGGHKGSAKSALKARSTAYGMGQILSKRWLAENAFAAKHGGVAYPHDQAIDPKISIWTTAASLGRMAYNRGGGPGRSLADQVIAVQKMARGIKSPSHQGSLAVGHWWAGQTPGAVKGAKSKVRQILVYGPQVWDSSKRPSSSWQKATPAARPEDDLPPWKTGSLSSGDYPFMLASASALEAAGNELRELNPQQTT